MNARCCKQLAWAVAVLGAIVSSAAGAAPRLDPSLDGKSAPVAAPALQHRITLKEMGAAQPVRLRGVEHSVDFPFAVRSDEIVTGARLRLRYAHSPALVYDWSHLSVLVNGEVVGNVALDADSAGGGETVVEIDPRTLVGYSRLGLRSVLHYGRECEDPAHSSLWAVIANDSVLEFDVERVALPNDLALLPEPFFDPRDRNRLELPILLPAEPADDELEAAAMIASWFGSLAEYRHARFPVRLGEPAGSGHSVAVGTRARLEQFNLAGKGAEVAVITNPADARGKLLLVTGDDTRSLLAAARALVLGSEMLSGERATITDLDMPAARAPYDAPRWMPTDGPVRLGDHVAVESLQVEGQYPSAIRVAWDLPPDLFFWQGRGARFDIGYRYTASPGTRSTLDLDVNNQFARALPLLMYEKPRKQAPGADARADVPLVSVREQFRVPYYKFGSDNELKWQFNFEVRRNSGCEELPQAYLRGAIDADSTIDFSGLPHYTRLPDLSLFTNGAFPYSRFADLSDTVAILPQRPDAAAIEALFNVIAYIGNTTGYPATRLRVTGADNAATIAPGADLLVFGTPANQPLLERWSAHLPIQFADGGAQLQAVGPTQRLRARFNGRDLDGARNHAARMMLEAGERLGAILSFESPMSPGRTAIAFVAPNGKRLLEVVSLLSDDSRRHFVGGDLTLLNGTRPSRYALTPQYTVGELPRLLRLRWWFAQQPLILTVFAIVLALVSALILYRVMRGLALARHEGR